MFGALRVNLKVYLLTIIMIFSGVIARHEAILPYLRERLTEEAVAQYFSHVFNGETGPNGKFVQRFELVLQTLRAVQMLLFFLVHTTDGWVTFNLVSGSTVFSHIRMMEE